IPRPAGARDSHGSTIPIRPSTCPWGRVARVPPRSWRCFGWCKTFGTVTSETSSSLFGGRRSRDTQQYAGPGGRLRRPRVSVTVRPMKKQVAGIVAVLLATGLASAQDYKSRLAEEPSISGIREFCSRFQAFGKVHDAEYKTQGAHLFM